MFKRKQDKVPLDVPPINWFRLYLIALAVLILFAIPYYGGGYKELVAVVIIAFIGFVLFRTSADLHEEYAESEKKRIRQQHSDH